MKPQVLERWPGLGIPWVPLGAWPTPIRPVSGDAGGRLWVKDEGRSGARYGGNKVRKLEHLLADALAEGRGDVLTLGAVGSNHVVATALYGRQVGLRPYAVVFPQPDTPYVRRNARLIDALCEGWIAADRMVKVPWAWAREWTALRLMGGGAPYAIVAGGSDPLGTIGWVSAGLEIAAEIERGAVPRFDRVYAALGSGGTVAGLWLGLRIAGVPTEVVGVRVVDRVVANEGVVRRLAKASLRLLRERGADVPDVRWDGLRIVHDWFAGGYGRADDRVRAAMAEADRMGLAIEPTYTGKTLGACLAEASRGGTSLFVDTINAVDPGPLLEEALPDVPEGMVRLLK